MNVDTAKGAFGNVASCLVTLLPGRGGGTRKPGLAKGGGNRKEETNEDKNEKYFDFVFLLSLFFLFPANSG